LIIQGTDANEGYPWFRKFVELNLQIKKKQNLNFDDNLFHYEKLGSLFDSQ